MILLIKNFLEATVEWYVQVVRKLLFPVDALAVGIISNTISVTNVKRIKIMFEIKGKYTTAKIMIDGIEEKCASQIHSFVNHEVFTNPVAIMPDTHAGKGSVIGFTMEMTDRIIPNVIGVDINCGMTAINIGKELPLTLAMLDHKIRQQVPFGMNVQEKSVIHMEKEFPWRGVNTLAQKFSLAYQQKFGTSFNPVQYSMDWFLKKVEAIGMNTRRAINSIGSIGGGNHYIETGLSTKGEYWITIHTGSRNFGKCVCEYWQNKASKKSVKDDKEENKKKIADLKEQYTGKELYEKIKEVKNGGPSAPAIVPRYPEDQRWLEGDEAKNYLMDMLFAQVYAEVNREHIIKIILGILGKDPLDKIETAHNFIDFKDFIIRKGAVRSYVGERFILPFNMRDGILICEGKSNPDWNFSAPHGAGRVMSRAQAKRVIDVEAFKKQMEGIYSSSVGSGTLDEAPDAYKNPVTIEEAIGPTATILDRIKPVHNMKASESEEMD